MKKPLIILILVSSFFTPFVLFSQHKCEVLLPSISGIYVGKCKRGLANGKGIAMGVDTYNGHFKKGLPDGMGTYTWASGAKYVGAWNYGKREGKGTYSFTYNNKDSIQGGIWENDKYLGPVPTPPVILQCINVQNYSFRKIGTANKFSIEIYVNGAINSTLEDLVIFSTNGSYQNYGKTIVFNFISFPATFKITYKTWNKMHTQQYDAVFEFSISEPGSWLLRLNN
jgi:hypothetical protein